MLNYDHQYAELNKVPRYMQIKYELQQFLAENNWEFNSPIPSEQELAATYDASIGTIRKAVECLVEEGVLIKHQGKGTFLKHPAFIQSAMTRFYLSQDKYGKPQIPTSIVKKIEKVDAVPVINHLLGLTENEPLIYLERVRLADNVVIISDKIWLSAEKFGDLLSLPIEQIENLLYPLYFKLCGQLVVSAKEKMTILTQHSDPYLTDNQPDCVVKVCREAKGLDGNIIEYRESYGLAKDFYYETIIT
ncbi:GntR family transcriptional regulator [uncultured Actinobacillus sp.]|uniref:GntR family transcriptional regulator n=1 Tax=uncultured Actinobacillus sp. TaxID=417616 RepID=UPI0025D1745F|nr:GntR family transcriptional regulator [uncultured Actinobacillus sp.]